MMWAVERLKLSVMNSRAVASGSNIIILGCGGSMICVEVADCGASSACGEL